MASGLARLKTCCLTGLLIAGVSRQVTTFQVGLFLKSDISGGQVTREEIRMVRLGLLNERHQDAGLWKI